MTGRFRDGQWTFNPQRGGAARRRRAGVGDQLAGDEDDRAGRATVVGEVTGGGAHPVSGHRIDEHFTIGVPFARAVNPISKKNWEGTGVLPDVSVAAADALTTAQRLAKEKLAAGG